MKYAHVSSKGQKGPFVERFWKVLFTATFVYHISHYTSLERRISIGSSFDRLVAIPKGSARASTWLVVIMDSLCSLGAICCNTEYIYTHTYISSNSPRVVAYSDYRYESSPYINILIRTAWQLGSAQMCARAHFSFFFCRGNCFVMRGEPWRKRVRVSDR